MAFAVVARYLVLLWYQTAGKILPLLVFSSGLTFYWLTITPGVAGHDAGEFQFVPPILGIAHHTGYPLYTLLGYTWSLWPIDSVAYRMNLFSAVLGAGAITVTYFLARDISKSVLIGLLGASVLAVTPLFWRWSTVAGVRSGSVLAAVSVLYLAIVWSEKASRESDEKKGHHWLLVTALALGMALAHHRTAVCLVPGLIFYLLLHRKLVLARPRQMLMVGLAATLPLLSYLYLPIRSRSGAPFDQFHPDTWERFWDLVLAVPLSQSFFTIPPDQMVGRTRLLGEMLTREFGWPAMLLALIGTIAVCARRPKVALMGAPFLVLVGLQTIAWNTSDKLLNEVYFLPAYPVLAVLVASGINSGAILIAWLAARVRLSIENSIKRIAHVVLVGLMVILLVNNGLVELHQRQGRENMPLDRFRTDLIGGKAAVRLVLGSLPNIEPDGLIICYWEQATPFWYYQLVEKINPSVEIAYGLPTVDEYLTRFPDRPIYLATVSPEAIGKRLTMTGPLVRVLTQPTYSLPTDVKQTNFRLEGGLELIGVTYYDSYGHRSTFVPHRQDVVAVQLWWRAAQQMDADYAVSVRLLDGSGKVAAQQDNQHPVLGMYPTKHWVAGEVVGDYYELPRSMLPPGEYRLDVVVYQRLASGFKNQRLLDIANYPTDDTIILTTGITGAQENPAILLRK
jgi:uncharacterized membrane protein